jgi:hypothetical protein
MPFHTRLSHHTYSLMFEDNDYGLFSVTVFRKIEQDFKTAARDKKCVRQTGFVWQGVSAKRIVSSVG